MRNVKKTRGTGNAAKTINGQYQAKGAAGRVGFGDQFATHGRASILVELGACWQVDLQGGRGDGAR